MNTFAELGLAPATLRSLARVKFETPTPIQAKAIPFALQGRDILGSAQTGTGKTAAFAIPMLEKLMADPQGKALVLVPTRELAAQVLDSIRLLADSSAKINTVMLIGGEAFGKQLAQLKKQPRIIVGTPGRINDHIRRRTLKLDRVCLLVLDETDRMLDMGFADQIETIIDETPEDRQTMMFSATLPQSIMSMTNRYLRNPERVAASDVTSQPAENIKQTMHDTTDMKKFEHLLEHLQARTGSIIIFVNTKREADQLTIKIQKNNHAAEAIHGDLRQQKRDRVIKGFRSQRFRILVATDVAARGLDIPHVEHVINYDLPQCPEDYVHRIGRTARAGATGEALSLVSPRDFIKWYEIQKLVNPEAARAMAPKGRSMGGGKRRSGASRGPARGGFARKRRF